MKHAYNENQKEAYGLYDIIKRGSDSLNFLLNFYEPKNNIYKENVFQDRMENKNNFNVSYIKYTISQYVVKSAFENHNIKVDDFEALIKKFKLENEKLEITTSRFKNAYLYESNEVEFKKSITNLFNNLVNQNKDSKKEYKLEDFISVEDINFEDMLLYSISSTARSEKLKKLLKYFEIFNIKITEDNIFAQKAATYFLEYPKLFEEYKKYVDINFKDLNIFNETKKSILERNFNFTTAFSFYGNQEKNKFFQMFKNVVDNTIYNNTEDKFNHIKQFLIKAKESGQTDMGKMFTEFTKILNVDQQEYEKLEEKYLKFAIEQNYYIKDIVEISKPIYKRQKTHLFTIDGDYFYTLAVVSPKFFNSTFSKLKDEIKIKLINSNLKGKNIFSQLFVLKDNLFLSYLSADNIKFILNNFKFEEYKEQQNFLMSLLEMPKEKEFIKHYYYLKDFQGLMNINENFINFYKEKLNIEFNQETSDFINYIKIHNFCHSTIIKDTYEKNNSNHKKSSAKIFAPFAFIKNLPYEENTFLTFFENNQKNLNIDFLHFYLYMGDNKNYSEKYYQQIFQSLIETIDEKINSNEESFTLQYVYKLYDCISFIDNKKIKLETSYLNKVKNFLNQNEKNIYQYIDNSTEDNKKAASLPDLIDKIIFNNEITSNIPKVVKKFKI